MAGLLDEYLASSGVNDDFGPIGIDDPVAPESGCGVPGGFMDDVDGSVGGEDLDDQLECR